MYNASFHKPFRTEVGSLNLDLSNRGKRMFIWKYTAFGAKDPLVVEVSLLRVPDVGTPIFSATCDRLPSGELRHTDLAKLAELVKEQLDTQAAALSGFAWEDWLRIEVKGSDSLFEDSEHAGMGAALRIQVSTLKRAIHPVLQEPVTINSNNCVVRLPPPTAIGAKPNDLWVDDRDMETAYVPDTPENRAALETIAKKMRELRTLLADKFSQEKAPATLKQIDSNFLLNPPDTE